MKTATTILNQLGGNKFIAMTGAKNMAGDDKSLQFSIGRGAKKGINKVRVILTESDLYNIEFYKISRTFEFTKISECSGVYADMIKITFTKETGFDTNF